MRLAYVCHGFNTSEGIWPRPYDNADATIVAIPFIEYQMETRTGCSTRRYHWPVRMVKSGMHPASKRPRKNRAVTIVPKLWHADIQVAAMPQPRIIVGIRIRGGVLTMSHAEKGCQASWAMGEIDAMREY